MDNLAADFTIENNNPLEVEYELTQSQTFDCSFELFAAGTVWGSIDGDINNQTDLINILNDKVDSISFEDLTQTVGNNYTILDTKIDGIHSELSENIEELETNLFNLSNTVTLNNSTVNNRIDTTNTNLTNLTVTVNGNNTEINNRVNGIVTSFDEDIEGINTVISNLETTVTDNNTALNNRVNTLEASIDADIEELNTHLSDLADTVGDNYTDLDDKITQLGTTVSSNHTTLNTKIDNINSNLSSEIQDLETELTELTVTVSNNDTAINQKVDSFETYISEDINTLSATVSTNYTTLDTKIDNTKTELKGDITTLSGIVTSNYNDLNSAISTGATTINSRIDNEVDDLNAAITSEATTRENADNALQSQIDAITAASDVVDIVGTYAQLQAYNTSNLQNNDIIKVLSDESRDDETTYYRWVITDGIGAWSFIGEEGPYYTKSETDSQFVPQTRTINNKPLSDNITLIASDINALPDTTVIGDGVLTLQKNGVSIDTFNANATTSKTINLEVPTTLSELTNDSGFITGISSNDIIIALGYTPYSNANPEGFITNTALSNYVTNTSLETTLTNYVTDSTLQTSLNSKQPTLVSGINIKSINGNSLLGSGNIVISNGYIAVEQLPTVGEENTFYVLTEDIETDAVIDKVYQDGLLQTFKLKAGDYRVVNLSETLSYEVLDYTYDSNNLFRAYDFKKDFPGDEWGYLLNNEYSANFYMTAPTQDPIPTSLAGYDKFKFTWNADNDVTNVQLFRKKAKAIYVYLNGFWSEVPDLTAIITTALNGYATEDWVNSQNYLTDIAIDGYATKDWVNEKGYLTDIAIDNTTINKNISDKLQAVALVDGNAGEAIKTWTGTLAEYNAITAPDENTLYNITDDNLASTYEAYNKSETNDLIAALKSEIMDEFYYKAGDTFILQNSFNSWDGFLTGSRTNLRFNIQLPKSMANIPIENITLDRLVLDVRLPTGGYMPSANWDAVANADSIDLVKGLYTGNSLCISINSATIFQSYTNNISCSVCVKQISLTFGGINNEYI